MLLEDFLAQAEIRRVMNRYNLSGDANDVEALAACFTEDGILETSGTLFAGRETILNGLNVRRRQRRANFVRHHLTTTEITLTGDGTASARSYFIVITDIGIDRSGVYSDKFRKDEGVWKIERRSVSIDFCSTDTRMNSLGPKSQSQAAEAAAP